MEVSVVASINFILFLCFVEGQTLNLTITLNEPKATIKGHALKSHLGNDFYAFQDIPYAVPPVGEFRFAEPQPHQGWSGILDTTRNVKECVKLGVDTTEDCLVLNVYVPVKDTSEKFSVFVWIHGGDFKNGSGAFTAQNPSYFIDYDIIIVTINYRLGPFGFLTTEDGVIPGNLGLKDQRLAFEWVYNNIAAFGGDPQKVTIGGQNAGAISTSYHIVSQKSRGLFKGAVLESGSSLTHTSYVTNARNYSFQLGTSLNKDFKSRNSTELLKLLRKASALDILLASQSVKTYGNQVGIYKNLKWAIVIEDETQTNSYITKPMLACFRDGTFQNVPILIGYNSQEMIAFMENQEILKTKATEHDEKPANLVSDKLNVAEKNLESVGIALKRLYTNTSFTENLASFVEYSSDVGFVNSVIHQADVSSSKVSVYLYEFSYKGINHKDPTGIPNLQGVGHSEELLYMWGVTSNNDEDTLTSKRLLTMWSNFIKRLNPTPAVNASLGIPIWRRLHSNNLFYLDIGKDVVSKLNPKRYLGVRLIFSQYLQPPYYIY